MDIIMYRIWIGPGGMIPGGYHMVDFIIAKSFKTKKFKDKTEFIVQDAAGSYFDYDDKFINEPRALVSLELSFLKKGNSSRAC